MPTILITGANRGIGLNLTRVFSAAGWRVLATCRKPESADDLKALADNGDISIHTLDVTDFDAIDNLAAELSGEAIDVLLNNAGVIGKMSLQEGIPDQVFGSLDYEDWAEVFKVNSMAPMKMAEAFFSNVLAGEQKVIATISSLMGANSDKMMGGAYAYRASKAAVTRVMTVMAIDLAEKGVTAVALHPGWVRTDMGTDAADISVEESVDGLFKVISGLGPADSGRFINYAAEDVPW